MLLLLLLVMMIMMMMMMPMVIGSNKDTEGCDLSIRDILVLVST